MWALWRKAANCFSDRRRQLLVSRLRGRCWPCTSPYKVTNNENKQLSAGASVEGRAMLRFIILWIEVARWLTIRQLLSSTDWHHWISSTKLAPTKSPLPQQQAYCIYKVPHNTKKYQPTMRNALRSFNWKLMFFSLFKFSKINSSSFCWSKPRNYIIKRYFLNDTIFIR